MVRKCRPSSFGVDEDYFMYLCELVDVYENNDYSALLKQLHSIEFSEFTAKLIDNDDNRIEDGLDIRREWDGTDDSPCTMLEMLIALARRVEDVIGNDYVYSFWEMMDNLGLMRYDDTRFNLGSVGKIDDAISDLLNRRYARDGSGGLFPLKHPDKDQRKVEIWYQMQAYLMENYL